MLARLVRFARRWALTAVGVVLVVAMLGLRGLDPPPVEGLRTASFDLWQKVFPRTTPERPPGVVVDIDEQSLARLGQWPWPRTRIAQLVDRLAAAGVASIAFDIVFAEPDRLSPPRYARVQPDLPRPVRRRLRDLPDSDSKLARALKGRPTLLGSAALPRGRGGDRPLPQVFAPPDGGAGAAHVPQLPGLVRNLPVLEKTAAGVGVFSLAPGESGVVRRVPQIFRHDGVALPGLALGALRLAEGKPTIFVSGGEGGIDTVGMQGRRLPIDRQGRLWLHYGHSDPARYISAVEVLTTDPAKLRSELKGRIAILGTSAPGLQDIHATPLGRDMPGAEIQAQVVAALEAGNGGALKRPILVVAAEVAGLALLGVALAVALPRLGAWSAAGLTLAVLAGLWVLAGWAFSGPGVLLDAGNPSALVVAQFAVLTSLGFAGEQSRRREIRNAFSHYVSPALVAQLAERPQQLQLGGEEKHLTVLLCDMRGFTTLSEQYRSDPQGLTQLIGRFFTALSDPVLARQGTIDKYIGDALMAFWNAPLDVPGHEAKACRAALDMLAAIERLNETLAAEAEADGTVAVTRLGIGIGLNSGPAFVGNMGAQERFDYSCLGDAVNVAARLEGQSKTYGVAIVVGPATREAAGELAFLALDRVQVKGRTAAVTLYGLVGDEDLADRADFQELAGHQDRFLARVAERDWDGAAQALADGEDARQAYGLTKLGPVLQEHLDSLRANPPGADWDGATSALEK